MPQIDSTKRTRRAYGTGQTMAVLGFAPTFKLNVDSECIEKGIRENSNHCMIARAVKKAHPELERVAVDIQTIRATNTAKGERYIWLTPPTVQRMIVDFDAGRDPAPAKCTLSGGQTVKISRRERALTKKSTQKARAKHAAKMKIAKSRGGLARRPDIIGGHEPPRAIGARRRFGMRGIPINQAA